MSAAIGRARKHEARRTGVARTPAWLRIAALAFAALAVATHGRSGDEDVAFVNHLGGACHAIEAKGHYAYAGEGPYFSIYDISISSSPVRLGHVPLPALPWNVSLTGGLAAVALQESGVAIIDVANPLSPVLRATYRAPAFGCVYDVYASGTLVYVAERNGLQILDVANPDVPRLRAFLALSGRPLGLHVCGHHGYAACDGTGLQVIDVHDPDHPIRRGTYASGAYTRDVFVAGNLAYLVCSPGIHIVDVSDPSVPRLRSTYDSGSSVFASESLAFVVDDSGLKILDVVDPDTPKLLGSMAAANLGSIHVSDSLAVLGGWSGIQLVDVTRPSHPVLRGAYEAPPHPLDICASGTLVYTADPYGGLQIYDLAIPTAPELRGACRSSLVFSLMSRIVVSGDFAYGACFFGPFQIIDVHDPSSPTLMNPFHTFPWPGGRHVFPLGLDVVDSVAYVASKWDLPGCNGGLITLDTSDPSSPQVLGSFDSAALALDVAVADGLAYVVSMPSETESGKLQILDIRAPASPVLVGTCDLPDPAIRIHLSGDVAQVLWSRSNLPVVGGLQLVDVAAASSPTLLGRYEEPDSARDFAVSGDLAYVAFSKGLRVVDVSDPSAPKLCGSRELSSAAESVAVAGNLVCVASGGAGLSLFLYHKPTVARPTWELYR